MLILYTYYFMYTYFVYKHNRVISSPMQVGVHVVLTGNFPEHASRVISTLAFRCQVWRLKLICTYYLQIAITYVYSCIITHFSLYSANIVFFTPFVGVG